MTVSHTAVIGLGVIGSSWVARFLGAGLQVRCFDPSPTAMAQLDDMLLGTLGDAVNWRPRLYLADSLDDAVHGAQLVQENGPEGAAAKKALIEALDAAAAPSALIASSTSGHRPSDLQAMASHHPERVLVAHPLNPPHLIALLELVSGTQTPASVRTSALRFYESLGMRVVSPRAEKVGHVANRLQAALLREAFSIAIDGTLDVPDIDAVLTHGLALRWACAGPFALTELGGGAGGSRAMLTHLGPALNGWWRDLSTMELDARRVDALLDALAKHPPQACSKTEAENLALAMLRYRAFCDKQLSGPLIDKKTTT